MNVKTAIEAEGNSFSVSDVFANSIFRFVSFPALWF